MVDRDAGRASSSRIVCVHDGAVRRTFASYVPVTLTSDRTGLVMEPGAKVKMRGRAGRAGRQRSPVATGRSSLKLRHRSRPGQVHPGQCRGPDPGHDRVRREVRRLDLSQRPQPSSGWSAGAVLSRDNVSTEVNTVFQNLVGLLNQIDPAKLNAVLVRAGRRRARPRASEIGEAITDANQVLLAINPRTRDDPRRICASLKGFSDTYGAAAHDILAVLDAASTTSTTITGHVQRAGLRCC